MSDGKYLSGEFFMSGDEACAEGAINAGCRFFAGYPITPATEIAERMSERMPEVGGTYMQMEDELASMAAILGASWGGVKAMTATSGPGFSLMMENIGLGVMLETPCVVVDIQRAGPSTGLPTLTGQGDMMQARWGSHGCYSIIALAPNSPQELYDLTITAFNLSEQYRLPVLIMSEAATGHMYEKIVIRPVSEIEITARRKPVVPPDEYLPFEPGDDLVPSMASAGSGYRLHVTGLTHDERGYPTMTAEAQSKLVRRLIDKVERNKESIIRLEEDGIDDAEVVVCSYGISARVSLIAIEQARQEGIKVGLLRLITVWPFPEDRVREIAGHIGAFVVPEINCGQISLEVERCAGGKAKTVLVPHMGGRVHDPESILEVIRQVAR
ncbi:MAG: 2-oxoacid:acceptor oxidoreductase subunit alpha [Dehalococcoidales bacterium]|nr:2-oxoacid:acceptor oxidoreductase subunit alpha [Dehalococcoidales bacterium]